MTLIDPSLLQCSEILVDSAGREYDTQLVNESPDIRVFTEFFDSDELAQILRYIERNEASFKQSHVGNYEGVAPTDEECVSTYRTSESITIESAALTRSIRTKVARLLNCKVSDVEAVQIVRYGTNQYYYTHHDSFLENGVLQRDHTFFVYLNTVHDGGSTSFPYLQKSIMPRAGAAVHWKNLTRNGASLKRDGKLRHRGDPIAGSGIKYGMNIWVTTDRRDVNVY